MQEAMVRFQPDSDRIETQEWLDALAAVVHFSDIDRAAFLLNRLAEALYRTGYQKRIGLTTSYVNTLPASYDQHTPNESAVVDELAALLRWNAAAMVLKAGKVSSELGGHISTYASIATLYEVGFDYFFKACNKNRSGDLIYFQGHSIPGIYARAFLEGRLSSDQLGKFRQEALCDGLSSYPHPWLMPDFWQFPTVSMGLGPLSAIYQARFLRYLENRDLVEPSDRAIWAFCGDGEMDEPESVGALSIAAREQLDNLIFVINCNLQRLDGPVRGNGKIVQEMERIFTGAGWRVIKLLWNSAWDKVFALDADGHLTQRLEQIVDGQMQHFATASVTTRRAMLFAEDPHLQAMSDALTDDDIMALGYAGHDRRKIYAAYHAATSHRDGPVVILAHSVKGFGLGAATEGMNVAHNQKKLSEDDLKQLRARFNIPIDDAGIREYAFVQPELDSPVMEHLRTKRAALGGGLPWRRQQSRSLDIPDLSIFSPLLASSESREISSTMAFVRVLSLLLRDKNIASHLVPIVPDESRTFGMEGLFRQIGIYAAHGQQYEPVDKSQIMYYKEAKNGQLIEEGINEAGAFAAWLAAATSYSNHNIPMIPFYIYYSMFGFQRIGDLAWAAGDARARGFLIGATAGRTTLAGEGLQHTDGHSHVFSSVIPNCISYDPTYAYELAVIIQHGMNRMYAQNEDVYFYITVTNENYTHPAMPKGVEEGIVKGMYPLHKGKKKPQAVLLGSGTILREVEQAAELLARDFDMITDVWSVTSFTELKRDAERADHHNQHDINAKPQSSYVAQQLAYHDGPVIAATDYIKTFADQLRPHISQSYHVLGTDGYGRSDTRAHLRDYFGVDAKTIAYRTVYALVQDGTLAQKDLRRAHTIYTVDTQKRYTLDT